MPGVTLPVLEADVLRALKEGGNPLDVRPRRLSRFVNGAINRLAAKHLIELAPGWSNKWQPTAAGLEAGAT